MYTNDHRMLLQVIMNEGAIVEDKLKEYTYKLFSHRDFGTVCFQINEQLSTVNMMLKSALCDSSGETYWMVVSHSQLDFDTLHMPYSENEMNFLKTIFCEIVTSDVGCISSLDSLNLPTKQHFRMYKKEAQEFINDMVNKRWLSIREGWLFVGPRSTADLLNFFKDNFPDMLYECDLCKQNVFYGKLCHGCNRKTHFKCLRTYTEQKKDSMKCPSCKHAFDSIEDNLAEHIAQYHHSNGEDSVDVIQSQVQDERQPSTSRGKRPHSDDSD